MGLGSAACAWLPVAVPVSRAAVETLENLIVESRGARLNARDVRRPFDPDGSCFRFDRPTRKHVVSADDARPRNGSADAKPRGTPLTPLHDFDRSGSQAFRCANWHDVGVGALTPGRPSAHSISLQCKDTLAM